MITFWIDCIVLDDHNPTKICHLDSTLCNQRSLIIREPSTIDFSYSSSDDDEPIQLATTLPTQSTLKQIGVFELGECSMGTII
jgi:hypothetical protein